MNIGILTHHWVYNFGANLQTLSTINFIRQAGHNPFVINWIPTDSEINYNSNTKLAQIKSFKEFHQNEYPLTEICRTSCDIANIIRKYNIERVVIGSDTVFSLKHKYFSLKKLKLIYPKSNSVFPNAFWGDFLDYGVLPSVRVYSAATLDIIPHEFNRQKGEICRALHKLDKITVRDNATKDMISYFTDGNICPSITPDPVFCFNVNCNEYEITKQEICDHFGLPDHYVLVCFTEFYRMKAKHWVKEIAKIIQAKYNLPVYELPRQTGRHLFDVNQINANSLSPIEWYYLIKYSDAYIGQLMHPVIVSMHNAIPFYCLDYYGIRKFKGLKMDYTTSKVYQIVKTANMLERYCHIGERFTQMPKASYVIEKLFFNDYEKRLAWAKKMQEESQKTMTEIILDE